jgi:hypothetical protein
MRHRIRIAVALLLLLPATAAQAHEETDGEEVYVYTNADVEKLEPIPTNRPPAHAAHDPEAWAFVTAFIEHEREQIDADRNHALERERVQIEANRVVGYGERYPVYLRAPYYPIPPLPRVDDDGESDSDEVPATEIPHPMFRHRPPVREFVPGLGDSYRAKGSKQSPNGRGRR